MIDWSAFFAAVAVDCGASPTDFEGEGLSFRLDGLYCIFGDNTHHPVLPGTVRAAGSIAPASRTGSGMGVDVVHQDVVLGEPGLLRDHGTYSIGERGRDFHKVVGDDADLLHAVAEHKAMSINVLMDSVVQVVSGCEACEHGMLVFRS